MGCGRNMSYHEFELHLQSDKKCYRKVTEFRLVRKLKIKASGDKSAVEVLREGIKNGNIKLVGEDRKQWGLKP